MNYKLLHHYKNALRKAMKDDEKYIHGVQMVMDVRGVYLVVVLVDLTPIQTGHCDNLSGFDTMLHNAIEATKGVRPISIPQYLYGRKSMFDGSEP